MERDCHYLYELLKNKINCNKFYCSRKILTCPTNSFIEYFKSLVPDHNIKILFVDGNSTGKTIRKFMLEYFPTYNYKLMAICSATPDNIDYVIGKDLQSYIEQLLQVPFGSTYDVRLGKIYNWVSETTDIVYIEDDNITVEMLNNYDISSSIIFNEVIESIQKYLQLCDFHMSKNNISIDHLKIIYGDILKFCPSWKELNKYTTHLPYNLEYYAQIGQDKYYVENIIKYKRNGFFIDIGSHNGIYMSNTYTLEKFFNWNGICIEAQSNLYEQLVKNRKCITINSCVWSQNDIIVEFEIPLANEIKEGNDLLGRVKGLDGNEKYFKSQFKKKDIIHMKTQTFEKILDDNNSPKMIDYVSIDIEGSELEVLKFFNFDKYHINFITIEYGYRDDYLQKIIFFMESKGFIKHRINRFDVEFRNKSFNF